MAELILVIDHLEAVRSRMRSAFGSRGSRAARPGPDTTADTSRPPSGLFRFSSYFVLPHPQAPPHLRNCPPARSLAPAGPRFRATVHRPLRTPELATGQHHTGRWSPLGSESVRSGS